MGAGDATTPVGIMAGILESLCICAVNVYVLITGYFMCEARYSIRRIVRLWLEIAFYTILIPAALTILSVPVAGGEGPWQLIKYVLPISMEHYWFATAYFLLYLLIPILNKAVHALSRRQLKTIIITLLVFTCLIKTVSPVELATDHYGYDTLWFVVIYLIASYIRLYDVPRFNHPMKAAGTFIVSCVIIFIMHMVLIAYHQATGGLAYYVGVPFHYNYLFTLTAAIGLFYLFKFVHIREGLIAKLIRNIAPYTFGVYLIHEHIDIRDRWIPWFNLVLGQTISDQPLLYLLQALLYGVLLYVICVIIDMIRSVLFTILRKGLTDSVIDKKIAEIDQLFE